MPCLRPAADADRAMGLFRGYHYGGAAELGPGARVTFLEAGHILGAALTVFDLETEGGRHRRVGFAFDLGRRHLPLIRDPEYMENVDDLVLESTYGDRRHGDAASATDQLAEVIDRVIGRGGKLFIPSFALERAQEIIYHLARLDADGRLPKVPVYVDSPMAAAVTRIFDRSRHYFDDDFAELSDRIGRVMTPPFVRFTASVEESKAITASDAPCIVIAASGMCEYGRILHHLKHGIEDARNAVALVGYQAAHTLGRREVFRLDAFSAHADRDELIAYVERVRPRRVWLVHGEADARRALAEALRERNLAEVFLPEKGDRVELE